jgi:hypothetical protein
LPGRLARLRQPSKTPVNALLVMAVAGLVVPFIELCEPGQPSPYSTFPFIALALAAAAAAIAGVAVHRHPSAGSAEVTQAPGG